MKKVLFLCLSLLTFYSYAETTTDYLEFSEATLIPGGDAAEIAVTLKGSTNLYAGYQVELVLPEGLEMTYDEEGELDIWMDTDSGIYPKNKGQYKHQFAATYGVAGERLLRVSCISQTNAALNLTSGVIFNFCVKATSYAKPGTATIQQKDTKFGVYDTETKTTTQYVFADATITSISVSSNATAPLTISSSLKWSTCVLPFDCALPTGVTAYTCKEHDAANNVLKLSSATSLKAFTPYILYSESGYSGTLSGTVDASKYPTNGYVSSGYLNGAITVQEIASGYVLQNLSEGVKFYNVNGQTFSIPAGKCWINIPGASGASLRIEVEDVSAIENIAAEATDSSTPVYNIFGQKVNGNNKTITIKSGKKAINK